MTPKGVRVFGDPLAFVRAEGDVDRIEDLLNGVGFSMRLLFV